MLYHLMKDHASLSDADLLNASLAVESLLASSLNARNDPRYIKKFKNQPMPTINPVFLELRASINAEITKRQSYLTKEEMDVLTPEEIETINTDTMPQLKTIAKERLQNAN